MVERCSAEHFPGVRCERADGHAKATPNDRNAWHASDDSCWWRGDPERWYHGFSTGRCNAVDEAGRRCTNGSYNMLGGYPCHGPHAFAAVVGNHSRDAQEADAKDLLYSLGAP
jgi:hypothetical protein